MKGVAMEALNGEPRDSEFQTDENWAVLDAVAFAGDALAPFFLQDPLTGGAGASFEAVAALDPVTAKQVMQDFVRINQELGISILLNIHHVELALEYADRIIGIRAGKIVYDGPSDKVDQAVLDSIYGEDTGTEASV